LYRSEDAKIGSAQWAVLIRNSLASAEMNVHISKAIWNAV